MEIEGDEDLVVSQEGGDARAVAGHVNILFPKSGRDYIVAGFNEWRPKVMAHFEPRFRAHRGANLSESDLRAIVREVTLHWMGYCVMHRAPIRMDLAEWDHPQTRRIIRTAVERAFPRGSDEAAALCAQLMGITREAYLDWAEADESFLGIM